MGDGVLARSGRRVMCPLISRVRWVSFVPEEDSIWRIQPAGMVTIKELPTRWSFLVSNITLVFML